ncbi:IgGFc-binding protein-like [Dysidea avara]|uniref:IgGFc-binding protein-like n=1 Tax=Dysidea avara TaxID=196820 RepID=UPI00331DFAEF
MAGEFYMGFFKGAKSPAIVITSTEELPVLYSVEVPGVGFYDNGNIAANNSTVVYLPNSVIVSSYSDENKGIYVQTSSEKVTVVGQSSRESRRSVYKQRFMDSYVAIQYIDLCRFSHYGYYEYFVMTVHDIKKPSLEAIALVVGTEDNTEITLTVTQPLIISVYSTTANLTVGIGYSFVINRLETVYIGANGDLTGTRIITNKIITLLSGHQCGDVPWDGSSCSHLIEQIPPTVLWGKLHYVFPLGKFQVGYGVKILASEACSVRIHCTVNGREYSNTGWYPAGGYVFIRYGSESCGIYSSAKMLVVQFSLSSSFSQNVGGPMMAIVPPVEQYYSNFTFSTYHISYNEGDKLIHYVNIIVPAQYYQPDMIYLISGGVKKSLEWESRAIVVFNDVVEAYATTVIVSSDAIKIYHANPDALLTIMMYGFVKYAGYGSAFVLPHKKGTLIVLSVEIQAHIRPL